MLPRQVWGEVCLFPLLCFTSGRWAGHSRLDFSENNNSSSSAVQRCYNTALQELTWFPDTWNSSQHSPTEIYKPGDGNGRSWMVCILFNVTCGYRSYTYSRDLVWRWYCHCLEWPSSSWPYSISRGPSIRISHYLPAPHLCHAAAEAATRV